MPHWVRWIWVTLGTIAVLVYATTRLGDVLMMVAFALLLNAGLRPIMRWLERHGVAHGLAVPLTLLGTLTFLALAVWVAVPPILRQAVSLAQSLPGYALKLESVWRGLGERITWLPPPSHVSQWVASHLTSYVQGLLGVTSHVLSLGFAAFTVAFLLVNILQDGPHLRDQLLELVPPYRRQAARNFLELIDARVGHYVLGTICDFTLVGLVVALGLALIGVPNPLALGAIVGVFDILPFIGASIGAIPGLIVAFGISTRLGFEALAVYLVVQQLEGLVIYPNVVGRAVSLHPIWVLLALTIGVKIWGLAGALLGIPAALVLKTTLETWVVPAVARLGPPAALPTVAVTFAPGEEAPRETPPAQ